MRKHWLAICLCLNTGPLVAEGGLELLENMSEAMHSLNYSGTFVYRHKDKVETLQITHRNTGDHVDERVITLSGKPREIIRESSVTTCVLPESRLVIVDENQKRTNFPSILPQNLSKLPPHYTLNKAEKAERIAGRLCWVINVVPKDKYRYGYKLWIDQDTNLLLRSDLLNDQQKMVEQVLFTDLNVHKSIPDEAFVSTFIKENFRRQEIGLPSESDTYESNKWRAANLPPGFIMSTYKQRVKSATNTSVQQMVFSDGLASVSVFIEPSNKDKVLHGSKRRGALNVYGKSINDHHLTVVGDVPKRTVKLIAESIELEK